MIDLSRFDYHVEIAALVLHVIPWFIAVAIGVAKGRTLFGILVGCLIGWWGVLVVCCFKSRLPITGYRSACPHCRHEIDFSLSTPQDLDNVPVCQACGGAVDVKSLVHKLPFLPGSLVFVSFICIVNVLIFLGYAYWAFRNSRVGFWDLRATLWLTFNFVIAFCVLILIVRKATWWRVPWIIQASILCATGVGSAAWNVRPRGMQYVDWGIVFCTVGSAMIVGVLLGKLLYGKKCQTWYVAVRAVK